MTENFSRSSGVMHFEKTNSSVLEGDSVRITQQLLLEAAQAIVQVSRGTSSTVPSAVLQILIDKFDLKAASFYSYSDIDAQSAGNLSLRAQVGLSYSGYESFVLSPDSTAGRCTNSRKIEEIEDVGREPDYRDKKLIKEFGLRRMLAIPIEAVRAGFDTPQAPKVLGVICVYAKSNSKNETLRRAIDGLRPIIAEAYVQSIDSDKLRFREQVTQRAIASADLNSFLFRVCRLLQEEWPYEASSIFIHDERAEILRLGATTGLRKKMTKQEVFVILDRQNDPIAQCFVNKETILYIFPDGDKNTRESLEIVSDGTMARVYVPLFEPAAVPENRRVIGVLRVANKVLRHEGRIEVFSFAWEDIEFLRFVCDVIGVIASLFDRVSKSKDDFERALHGVQNNLNGVLSTLDFIDFLATQPQAISRPYLVPTAKAQLQALAWQIERFAGGSRATRASVGKCYLLRDVFAKLGPLIRPLALSFSTKIAALPDFNATIDSGIMVRADPDVMLVVFRNLFENSIKYSNPDTALKIGLEVNVEGGGIFIRYWDDGMGILPRDASRLFHEGYRAESAMRRCTVGAGLGLFQCRELLGHLNGKIELTKLSNPTEFLVSIPAWSE